MVTATSIPNPIIAMLNGSYAGILNMVRLQTDTYNRIWNFKNGIRVDRRRHVF